MTFFLLSLLDLPSSNQFCRFMVNLSRHKEGASGDMTDVYRSLDSLCGWTQPWPAWPTPTPGPVPISRMQAGRRRARACGTQGQGAGARLRWRSGTHMVPHKEPQASAPAHLPNRQAIVGEGKQRLARAREGAAPPRQTQACSVRPCA